jgi:hypothetical protein
MTGNPSSPLSASRGWRVWSPSAAIRDTGPVTCLDQDEEQGVLAQRRRGPLLAPLARAPVRGGLALSSVNPPRKDAVALHARQADLGFVELPLRADGTDRKHLIVGAEIRAPTGRARPALSPALNALETMVAVDGRLFSPDGGRKPLPTGLLEETLRDTAHLSIVDRGRVFFEEPIDEPKPLVQRKIRAYDKRRQYGKRVVRRVHQRMLSWVAERGSPPHQASPDI